jgi:hypothetical protein
VKLVEIINERLKERQGIEWLNIKVNVLLNGMLGEFGQNRCLFADILFGDGFNGKNGEKAIKLLMELEWIEKA